MNSGLLNLFTPISIGKLTAKNRFVAQSMESNSCLDDGNVSPAIYEKYRKLAQGQWGVIFVEQTSLDEDSRARGNGLILNKYTAKSVEKLIQTVKNENPDTLFMFQIGPCGTKSQKPVALIHSQNPETKVDYPILSTEEITQLGKAWVDSCVLAAELGADGVDFKLCHGYFGNEMIRPSNIREDKYGGKEFEKRTYLFQKCVYDIKNRVSSKFVVGSRLSFFDGIKGGFGCKMDSKNDKTIETDPTEVFKIIDLMADLEMDYINLSAGTGGKTTDLLRPKGFDMRIPQDFLPNSKIHVSSSFWNYHAKYSKMVKDYVDSKNLKKEMKVMNTGISAHKNHMIQISEQLISQNWTDFMGFGRMTFSDPLFPTKLAQNSKIFSKLSGSSKNSDFYDFLNTSCNFCTGCEGCTKLLYNQQQSGCVLFSEKHKTLLKELMEREAKKMKKKL